MYFVYKSNAEIDEYGYVMFEVEGDEQLFSFRVGISEMVLAEFFSDLSSMLNGEIHSFAVDGNEAMTYYTFKRNGKELRIETKHHHIHEVYEFSFHNFCKALQVAFRKFFRQQRMNNKEEATQEILDEWIIFNKTISLFY
ncbi:hypothetical protein ACERII_19495 [Evansella sp. AB-rgal1]|uniref:hypothetical protein n=1 Tax=Evansella sp. AB-rgal1 TaxID=3242696 RepID=UPI00359D205D